MNETELISSWVAERRARPAALDAEIGDDVMARVRQSAAVASFPDRFAVAVRELMPARRHRLVYLGGGAFAGALRVIVILYLVLGIS